MKTQGWAWYLSSLEHLTKYQVKRGQDQVLMEKTPSYFMNPDAPAMLKQVISYPGLKTIGKKFPPARSGPK